MPPSGGTQQAAEVAGKVAKPLTKPKVTKAALVAVAVCAVAVVALVAASILMSKGSSGAYEEVDADTEPQTEATYEESQAEAFCEEGEEEQSGFSELASNAGNYKGESFTFSYNGSAVQIPCTYEEFLVQTGLEPNHDPEYAVYPDDAPDSNTRVMSMAQGPGAEDTVIVMMDSEGKSRCGDCIVYEVGIDWQNWDDELEVTSYELVHGVRLGMSYSSVCDALGEPDRTWGNDGEYNQWMDGNYFIQGTVDKNGEMWILGGVYNPDQKYYAVAN